MDDPKKRNIAFVVFVIAALVSIAYFGPLGSSGVAFEVMPFGTAEGEVLSVEAVAGGNTTAQLEAVVKLTSGETVRAQVPAACIVFAGQIATLSHYGSDLRGRGMYTLTQARDKNDS